jgi:2Fe-2S ferredoxin
MKNWFKLKNPTSVKSVEESGEPQVLSTDKVVLIGRTKRAEITPVMGSSLLKLALKNKVDWNYSCQRGSCGRCYGMVTAGGDCLSAPTEFEQIKLSAAELAQGYRLACQTKITQPGAIAMELRVRERKF